ncbi:MCL1, BCL2 family apoptosis regulator a [Silurus meridionalis]|nr:MCL1, BCL2 family apoptosis regulator a [Silurus meridionalis]
MSMNMMNRTAPLSLLYCGVENGGGVCAAPRFRAPVQTFPQKREEELDGYTEEADKRTVRVGISEREVPPESRLQRQGGGCEELMRPSLETETRELLGQLYRSYSGLPVKCWRNKSHSALPSLHRVVGKVLCKHKIAYSGMVQRLFEQANGLDSVSSVLNGVFSDGVISWGRIASVLALGAVDGFVEFFRVEDPESTVRSALMAVAGFGIGACLFTLMR